MKKYSISAIALVLMGLLSGCGNAQIAGEWYSVENPQELHMDFHSDGTLEIFDKNDYIQGEWSVKDEQMCMSVGSMGVCASFEKINGVDVMEVDGEYMARGLENAMKLHEAESNE